MTYNFSDSHLDCIRLPTNFDAMIVCGAHSSKRSAKGTRQTLSLLARERERVEACGRQPCRLLNTVNTMLNPPQPSSALEFDSNDFAIHVNGKIATIRSATSAAMSCHASFSSFQPVT
jgi:hypothetical protein